MTTDPTYPLSYVPVNTTAPRTVGADYLPTAPTGPSVPPPFVFPGTDEVNPAEVLSGPGYQSPTPPSSVAARLSMVLAVLGIVPGLSIGAIAIGHYALLEIARSRKSGRGIAVAGLTLGYMGLTVWALIGLLALANG